MTSYLLKFSISALGLFVALLVWLQESPNKMERLWRDHKTPANRQTQLRYLDMPQAADHKATVEGYLRW